MRYAPAHSLVGDLWCSLECTPACQAGGRGFKSRQVRHLGSPRRGRVAQLVERAPEKREVTGSTPVPTTEKSQFRFGVGNPDSFWNIPIHRDLSGPWLIDNYGQG